MVGMAFQEGKASTDHHPGWCAALQVLWGEYQAVCVPQSSGELSKENVLFNNTPKRI